MDHPIEPLSFKEIASRMGLRPSQVEGLYRSALKKLRANPEATRDLYTAVEATHTVPYYQLSR